MSNFLATFLAILAAGMVMLIVWRIYKRVQNWRAGKAMQQMMEDVDLRVAELRKRHEPTK